MLTYDMSERKDVSLYDYLYQRIKADIINHVIKPGEKLPSKRTLAENLNISIITVQNAYEELLYEGYIYSIEKKGYYAADIPHQEMVSNTSSETDEDEATEDDTDFDFTRNNVDTFPYSVWARLMRKVLLDNEARLFGKTDRNGVKELRYAIASYLGEYKGMDVKPSNIVVGAGMEYLYGLVVQLLGRNRMIAVEDPGHTKVTQVYEVNGVRIIHVPVDEKGFNPDIIGNANVSAIHICPSHQFPTGIIMPADRRHRITQYAKNNNVYVIEDDYDSEFRFSRKPLKSLASLCKEQVIYMNTFSKTLMGSLRIAYMVLPDSLMHVYKERLGFYSCTVSGAEQYTLARFIEEDYYERHINRTRLRYKRIRDSYINAFNKSKLSKKSVIIENDAGLHFIIKTNNDYDENALKEWLNAKKIRIMTVGEFCYRPSSEFRNCFIVNYYDESEERLIRAFDIIAEGLSKIGCSQL